MPLEYEELTKVIIAAAIEVHRRLGPGFLESIYENALVIELKNDCDFLNFLEFFDENL